MKRFISLLILLSLCLTSICQAQVVTFSQIGTIGTGAFIPTGDDADVARTSPIIQLAANVMFLPRIGFDAEFQYIPVLLEKNILSTPAHRKATQLALMGGLRFTSSAVTSNKPMGYLAARAGFARIAIRSESASYSGGWIGRPIDSLENPNAGLGFTTIVRQKGLALSPKVGVMVPLATHTAIDVALSSLYIFDSGNVASQYHITLSFSRIKP